MYKFIFYSSLLLLNFWSTFAQDTEDKTEDKDKLKDRIHFGGGVQLSFGNAYTAVGVSPSAIYDISDSWATGVGASYLYANDKRYNMNYNVLGGSALVLFNPIEQMQLNTEFEYLHIKKNNNMDNEKYWLPALYVGVGYNISKRGTLGIRYDLLWDKDKSIYNNALMPYFKFYF